MSDLIYETRGVNDAIVPFCRGKTEAQKGGGTALGPRLVQGS